MTMTHSSTGDRCVNESLLCCAAVSLENLAVDASELEKGIDATRQELEASEGCHASGTVLKTFLEGAEVQMTQLKDDCKKAQVTSIIFIFTCGLYIVPVIWFIGNFFAHSYSLKLSQTC